ncbi:thioredoxin reductase [Sporosarcina sp. P37]|uniref:NAD(P)/FAD-dependent oxidoreductase n=1 Tax=unclassified Sporosarcina TaxID=2647733 RepID=UPI0009BE5119|nr:MULTISPECIES: NAD(P)/FAD-dependent oxidoreductase [unclassified Sporosarcina]ARD48309.1 thioredoxin reductase [Sporosarcina sp. P33]ARK24814.1 thioredoxin reductase [Sporosarcina sp. P37]PID19973.1 NAD(P)/FAD-dependent oxidoreductase [Sporosarcina sp. P35]
MKQNELLDVTIIGGGPAGLYAAFYSGLREMKAKIIEYQPQLGGKIHVYPEKMIWDIGGITPAPGAQIIEQLVTQGLTFNPEVVLNEKIVKIEKTSDNYFALHGTAGTVHYSKTVILATGTGILNPQKIEVEGAERFEVTNLNYTVKSLGRFKDKTVLISGGGNAAIDWANELQPIAKKVYLTYRKDQLNGHEAQVRQLLESGVVCHFNTNIVRFIASDDHTAIEKVELQHNKGGTAAMIAVDEVIINHGYERDTSLIGNQQLGMELTEHQQIAGSCTSATSVEGLYAAGDVLSHDGKLHLIAGAFQDAANAVNCAKTYIDPEANQNGMVSSHNELFKERNRELVKQLI